MPMERVAVSGYQRTRNGRKERVSPYSRMQLVLRKAGAPRFFRLKRKRKEKPSRDPLTRLRQLADSAKEDG